MKKILAVSFLVASASAQAVPYSVQMLDSLSGNSWAYGLNDNGMVVGQSTTAAGDEEAVVWDSSGNVTSLGVVGLARAVNNNGLVVGETGDTVLGQPNGQAFMWQGSGPVVSLGTIGGGEWSGAYDVNENDVITGFTCNAPGVPDDRFCVFSAHAFRYDTNAANPALVDLGGVIPGGYSRGHGINDLGEIAGRASNGVFFGTDKLMTNWDAAGNLTFVQNPGISYSTAQQINNSGTIVGNGYAFGTTMRGMVWDDSNNLVTVMGTFGGESSRAWSINEIGTIVGYADAAGDVSRAMVSYDGGTTLLDLNDLAVDLTGWQSLDEAYDINENGQIVGIGTLSDGTRGAFMLTVVPIPAAVWLFLSACVALFGFRRTRA